MTVYVYVYEPDGITPVEEGVQVFAVNVLTGWETGSSGSQYWTTLISTAPAGVYDIYAVTDSGRVTETKRVTYQGESKFDVRLAVQTIPPDGEIEIEFMWVLPIVTGLLFSSVLLI